MLQNSRIKRTFPPPLSSFSLTLSKGYSSSIFVSHFQKRSWMASGRKVGVAVDFSRCSKAALAWASKNLVREGDHLILINVQPSFKYEQGEMQLWEATGSPLIPLSEFSNPNITQKYGTSPDKETLKMLSSAATGKGISITAKIYWGDAGEKICKAIENIPLHCLVIGSRGLGKVKRALLGSVSKYVVNHAVCPVTVVKNL